MPLLFRLWLFAVHISGWRSGHVYVCAPVCECQELTLGVSPWVGLPRILRQSLIDLELAYYAGLDAV